LGTLNRALRNIARRKIRALLMIIALGFSMAIMISVPAGIAANQNSAQNVALNLTNTINETAATLNQTLTQIECTLTPSFQGYGFSGGSGGYGGFGNGGGYGGFGGGANGGSSSGRFPGGLAGAFGGGAFGGESSPLNMSLYSDISSIQGVSAVVPILQVTEGQNQTFTATFGGTSRDFTRLVPYYIIEGIPLNSSYIDNYPILPTNITAGSNLEAGQTGVVLLSENNTAYFGVGVGGSVDILGENFTVVGVHGTSGVSDTLTLYMDLSDAQAITNDTGEATSLQVYADTASDVSSVASAISSLHPELTVTTAQQRLSDLTTLQNNYNAELQNAQNAVNTTQSTAYEEIVVAIVATSLIVLFVMLYTVRERTKEIGTLKAIGFSNWTVMSQFMLEGVMLSLIAGVVGIAIGSVAAPTLSTLLLPHATATGFRIANFGRTDVTVSLSPQLMLIGLGAAAALGTLGSLYPAWRASRTRPAEAMRYE